MSEGKLQAGGAGWGITLQGWLLHGLQQGTATEGQLLQRLSEAGVDFRVGSVWVSLLRLEKMRLIKRSHHSLWSLTKQGRTRVNLEQRAFAQLHTQPNS